MKKLSNLVATYQSAQNDGYVRRKAEKQIRKKLETIFGVLDLDQEMNQVLSDLKRANLSSPYGREKIIEETKREIFNV